MDKFLRRRGLGGEPQNTSLLTFEPVMNAVFYNRYNDVNQPYYCDISGNHVDFNTQIQGSAIWYSKGNLSAYNSQNKNFLFIPNGTEVVLRADYGEVKAYPNFRISLNDAKTTGAIIWGWISVDAQTGYNTYKEATKTATEDMYVYVSFVCTPSSKQFSVDIEIYLDGVRVV